MLLKAQIQETRIRKSLCLSMEGKIILLCLMVLVLLGNPIRAGKKSISMFLYMCFLFPPNRSRTNLHEHCKLNFRSFFGPFQFGIVSLMYVCCLQSIAKRTMNQPPCALIFIAGITARMSGTMSRKPTAPTSLFFAGIAYALFVTRVAL